MKYLITILFILNIAYRFEGNSQVNMKPLWWNIMKVIYVPGQPPPPPVLGPQGYGVNATGALAGDPNVTVTTTSGGTGVGSIYWAIFTATGATGSSTSRKNIVFDIAGAGPHTISVSPNNRLEVTQLSNVTFDGGNEVVQITSTSQNGLSFQGSGCHNVIIKNLYFIDCGASDNTSESDGLNVLDNAHDFCITNCAVYGNTDGNVDFANGATNCTMQYTIIGTHVSNATQGAGGTLITTLGITLHHNLFNLKSPAEGERAPLIHGNYANAFGDIRYNIVYNFGRNNATGSGFGSLVGYDGAGSGCGCSATANIVNNYYYTPSTAAQSDGVVRDNFGVPSGRAYSAGNISGNGINFNWTGTPNDHASQGTEFAVPSTFQLPFETTCDAVHNVLNNVGPTAKNATATTLIAQVTNLGTCNNILPPLFPDIKNGIWYSGTIYKSTDKQPFNEIMQESGLLNDRRNKLKYNI